MSRHFSTLVFTIVAGAAAMSANVAQAQNNGGYYVNEQGDGWYGVQMRGSGWGPPGVYTNVPYSQYSSNYNSNYYGYGNGAYGYGTTNPYLNSYYSGYGYGGSGNLPTSRYYGGSDPSFGNNGYDGASYRYFQKGAPYSRF